MADARRVGAKQKAELAAHGVMPVRRIVPSLFEGDALGHGRVSRIGPGAGKNTVARPRREPPLRRASARSARERRSPCRAGSAAPSAAPRRNRPPASLARFQPPPKAATRERTSAAAPSDATGSSHGLPNTIPAALRIIPLAEPCKRSRCSPRSSGCINRGSCKTNPSPRLMGGHRSWRNAGGNAIVSDNTPFIQHALGRNWASAIQAPSPR